MFLLIIFLPAGEMVEAHPSNYESVAGGLPEIRKIVEGLQRRFNEESKVCTVLGGERAGS